MATKEVTKNRLPDTIDIGYAPISIAQVDSDQLEGLTGCSMGAYSALRRRIAIVTGYGGLEDANTLTHELNHAIYQEASLEEGDSEERIVGIMTDGMIEAMRRNPELFDWIKDQIHGS